MKALIAGLRRRGTRITVELILEKLGAGETTEIAWRRLRASRHLATVHSRLVESL